MDDATLPERRRGAPQKVTRDQVLDAATRQINRRGVLTTLLRDVAAQLGVSRMTVYQHADDREDLVFRCYMRTCDQLETQVHAAKSVHGDATTKVRTLLRGLLGPECEEMCAIVEPGLLPAAKRKRVEDRFERIVAALATLLDEGMAANEVRLCSSDVVSRAIVNTTFWAPLANLWNRQQVEGSRRTVLETAEDLLLDGWASDRASDVNFDPIDLTPLSIPISDAFDRTSISDAKRERILAAASALFNVKGVDATTLEEIAAQVGATSRALYHNVGDKETLVAECYFRMMRLAIHLQKTAYDRPGSRFVSNTAFQHAWAMTQLRRDLSPLMPLTGFQTLRAKHQRRFHDYGAELTSITMAHVRAGAAEGSIRPLGRHALRLQGGVLGWLARSTYPPSEHEMVAHETAMLLARGIRALPKVKRRVRRAPPRQAAD